MRRDQCQYNTPPAPAVLEKGNWLFYRPHTQNYAVLLPVILNDIPSITLLFDILVAWSYLLFVAYRARV